MHRNGLLSIVGHGIVKNVDLRICRFGVERLHRRIRDFKIEIDGVKEGSNIEHVHGMRVASRRLRSALPLFSSCFPKKKYRDWIKSIKAVTRALGDARDTDVQLAFLARYLQEHQIDTGNNEGVSNLINLLEQQRKQQQSQVLFTLDALEGRGILDDLTSTLNEIGRDYSQKKIQIHPPRLYKEAAVRIQNVLDNLLSFDTIVKNPNDITGHHAMRIAAKKLRYTLEVYRPLYSNRFKPFMKKMKKLQEILGELHDCDIWTQILSGNLTIQSKLNNPPTKEDITKLSDKPELFALFKDREKRRKILYDDLVNIWEEYHNAKLWDKLRSTIDDIKATNQFRESQLDLELEKKDLTSIHALSGSFPEGLGHANQVTRLALILYDELTSLHYYGKKERFLLLCAGLLHDIGWVFGQKGHHTQSYRIILADKTLPLNNREKSIVALVARYHRKTTPNEKHKVFSSLIGKDKRLVQTLAALLRIADGLDYTHSNRVNRIVCTPTQNEVKCQIDGEGDITVEKSRAHQKSTLFNEIFSRKFVIL